VTYVEVNAYVTNADDDPVADLTADDFELIDAGSPQRITTFAAVNLPIARGLPLPAASGSIQQGVHTNITPEGRIYLVVLDDLHVDAARTQAVRTALHRFVEQDLGPTDMTAIMSTSGRADASAEFTTDRRHLIEIIDRLGPEAAFGHARPNQAARDERLQGTSGPQKKGDRRPPLVPIQCAGARVSRAKDHGHIRRLSTSWASRAAGKRWCWCRKVTSRHRALNDHLGDTGHKAVAPSSPKRRARSMPQAAATSPSMPSILAGSPTPLLI
jgi:VWFA-related protein